MCVHACQLVLQAELAAERLRLDVVGEGELAVDLDGGDQLAVAGLELRVTRDVDLLQLEGELAAQLVQLRPRLLAQVAALGAVEGDRGPSWGRLPGVNYG